MGADFSTLRSCSQVTGRRSWDGPAAWFHFDSIAGVALQEELTQKVKLLVY